MIKNFKPNCLPIFIGSLPVENHQKALAIVFEHTPEIPSWVQLPVYKKEEMLEQFLPGMPCVKIKNGKTFIDTKNAFFEEEILKFYEDYLSLLNKNIDCFSSRFTLTDDTAKGFSVFINYINKLSKLPMAIKGQITGPVTFGIGIVDQDNKSIFYDERLKDAAIKLISMKAKWQAGMLKKFSCPIIIFLDEPALAGFGSSSFLTVSREDGMAALKEVIDAIHSENGLAGIHICANSDWSLALETDADIISFDAYSFFNKFMLYPKHIKNFIKSERSLAWGIIPTANIEDIEKATSAFLIKRFNDNINEIEKLGLSKAEILTHSYITPSCGTGNLSFDHTQKVLRLTKEVSAAVREQI